MPLYCSSCGAKNSDTSKFCGSCGAELTSSGTISSSLSPGSVVGTRYKIIALIKAGGMGAVYKATDGRLDRICAVKELFSDYDSNEDQDYAIRRFNSEAKILSKLQHDHLPVVYDYFIENGRYYLVMSFIEGEDLDTILEREGSPNLPEDKVVQWSKQILTVLDYLHNQEPPIIYRDIKPANIMIRKDGRAMLVDFGIARVVNPEQRVSKTSIGTDGYAPKEQYKGQVEPRSDIYALGATMHHLLTGEIPVPLDFEPISFFNSNITPSLEQIVMKALEREVYNRFEHAKEMLDALETYKIIKQEQNISDDVFDLQIDEDDSGSDELYDLDIEDVTSGTLTPIEEGDEEELSVPGLLEWAGEKDPITLIREEEKKQSLQPKESFDREKLEAFSKSFEETTKQAVQSQDIMSEEKAMTEEVTDVTDEIDIIQEEFDEVPGEPEDKPVMEEEFDEFFIEENEGEVKEAELEGEFDELSIEESDDEEAKEEAVEEFDDVSIEEEREFTTEEIHKEIEKEKKEEIQEEIEEETEKVSEQVIKEKEEEIQEEIGEEIEEVEKVSEEVIKEKEEEIQEEIEKVSEEVTEEIKKEERYWGKEESEKKEGLYWGKEEYIQKTADDASAYLSKGNIFSEKQKNEQEEEVRLLEEELQKKVQEELRKLEEEAKEEANEEVIEEVKEEEVIKDHEEKETSTVPAIEDIIPSPQRKKQIKAIEIVRKPKEQIVKPLKSFNSLLKPFGANMPASIVHPKDEVEMIYIPSGLFVMGSDDPEDDNPKTHVYLYAYYIDKYPVTNFRYNIFLQETNYTEPESWNYSLQTADHPIIGIDWEDAKAYADWCGKRLPTEAEWEKAGRGTDERIYPWGQEWDKYKCNNGNMDDPDIVEKMLDLENDRGTTPIGSFAGGASPYGVMDMSGNIAEWCSDVYKSPLVSGKLKKGEKEKEKDLRVCKGGSWKDVPVESFRISHRRKALYYETFDDVGFRCCQTPRHL